MYFNQKEDTNIDEELKLNKKSRLNKKFLIIGGIVLGLIIIALIVFVILRNINRYSLVLNGNDNISIYQGSTYNEPGYNAYDNKKNNLNSEVTVKSNLDSNTIGTYTITYSLHNKTVTRTIKVVAKPSVVTIIYLNGDKNIYLNINSTYNEPGYSAIDFVDGDLTNQVVTTGKVDTSKKGTYRIVYSVVNSSGVTTSETRTIIVQ